MESPTSVPQVGVTIDFESCQVCHVSGDASQVAYTEVHVEYYDTARGSTSHLVERFRDDPLRTIDGRELGDRLPDTAEHPIVGEVEVWDVDHVPLTSLTQPAEWECRDKFPDGAD